MDGDPGPRTWGGTGALPTPTSGSVSSNRVRRTTRGTTSAPTGDGQVRGVRKNPDVGLAETWRGRPKGTNRNEEGDGVFRTSTKHWRGSSTTTGLLSLHLPLPSPSHQRLEGRGWGWGRVCLPVFFVVTTLVPTDSIYLESGRRDASYYW